MRVRLYFVCLVVAVASFLDYVTTTYLLSLPSFFEANPFAASLMRSGVYDLVKLSFTGLAAVMSFVAYRYEYNVKGKLVAVWYGVTVLACVCACVLIVAVVNNVLLMLGVGA